MGDMKELGIDLTMEEIAGTSKLRFKEIIRNKVETKALQYLTKLKESHSKARNIKHEKIKLQPYLRSETKNLTINERKFIFAARTRMLDLRGNFKTGMTDRKCRKCEATEETQQRLLDCTALGDSSLVLGTPSYDDLFGAKPAIIGKILQSKLKLLQTITPCSPVSAATTV